MRSTSSHLNHDIEVTTHAAGNVLNSGENSSDYKVANTHGHGTINQQRPPPRPIDIEEHDCCEDNEQRVLDTEDINLISSVSLSLL